MTHNIDLFVSDSKLHRRILHRRIIICTWAWTVVSRALQSEPPHSLTPHARLLLFDGQSALCTVKSLCTDSKTRRNMITAALETSWSMEYTSRSRWTGWTTLGSTLDLQLPNMPNRSYILSKWPTLSTPSSARALSTPARNLLWAGSVHSASSSFLAFTHYYI